MSLLIKDMDMPSSCQSCKLKCFAGNRVLSGCKPEVLYECPFCDALFVLGNKRQPTCKFEQLPTPHGDLIDRDDLLTYFGRKSKGKTAEEALKLLYTALKAYPTVIEKEMKQ